VHIERSIFSGEFDGVVVAGVTDKFRQRDRRSRVQYVPLDCRHDGLLSRDAVPRDERLESDRRRSGA
jgi:hypothetical protein